MLSARQPQYNTVAPMSDMRARRMYTYVLVCPCLFHGRVGAHVRPQPGAGGGGPRQGIRQRGAARWVARGVLGGTGWHVSGGWHVACWVALGGVGGTCLVGGTWRCGWQGGWSVVGCRAVGDVHCWVHVARGSPRSGELECSGVVIVVGGTWQGTGVGSGWQTGGEGRTEEARQTVWEAGSSPNVLLPAPSPHHRLRGPRLRAPGQGLGGRHGRMGGQRAGERGGNKVLVTRGGGSSSERGGGSCGGRAERKAVPLPFGGVCATRVGVRQYALPHGADQVQGPVSQEESTQASGYKCTAHGLS